MIDASALATDRPLRIGVVGTGFVATHFVIELLRRQTRTTARKACLVDQLSVVLSRRHPEQIRNFPAPEALTRDLDRLVEQSDLVFECTGDVTHATETIGRVLDAGLPCITLNPEFHVTTGSHFVDRGYLSEAEGDQPGSLAALWNEAVSMGFSPLVLGNMKGFLNRHPTPEEMAYWGHKQGLSLPMVTSFTDGTKLQVEQVLAGNFFGADIVCTELMGPETDDLGDAAARLGEAAARLGRPITDYVLSRKLPHGVFVVATHEAEQAAALRYLKMGEGPFYTLIKPSILVHLEVFKTIERVRQGLPPLLDNTRTPSLSVAAVAKKKLLAGMRIERGCGSFELRGVAIRRADHPDHLPIGLAEAVTIERNVEPGQMLSLDDVALPDTAATRIALDLATADRANRPFDHGSRRTG